MNDPERVACVTMQSLHYPVMPADRKQTAACAYAGSDALLPTREAAGSSHAMVVCAMTDFGSELRSLLPARGMSLRGVARQVPCDSGYLSKVAAGRKRPSAELAARLDEVLGAGGELAALAAARPNPGTEGIDLDLIELARRAGASDIGNGTLELLTASVDGLCRDYSHADAGELSSRTRGHLGYITRLLEGRTTLSQHRELLVLAGWVSALLACARYDAGDRPAARAACRMASQFAQQAGHGEIAAWSFEIAAWFALVEGHYPDTAVLAGAGMEHAGITSAAVQLALQAARAYARMGDDRAKAVLRAGRSVLDRLPEPAHPENHFAFDAAKYEFYVGTILTWLGSDDAAAGEHARYVVTSAGQDRAGQWPMRIAISELDLAVLAARRGDLDEAVALGIAALGHRRRSAQLLPRAAELSRDLAARYPDERLAESYAEALAGDGRALGPGTG